MAATISASYAPSSWRVRVLWTGGAAPLTPTAYALSRADGGPTGVKATTIFAIDSLGQTVDLALSEQLLDGVRYQLFASMSYGFFVWQNPLAAQPNRSDPEDPEAQVFGRDIDWVFGTWTPDGDAEEVRGVRSVLEDAVAVCHLRPGELVQYPDRGADFPHRVNGPGSASIARNLQARAESEWRNDNRNVDVSAQVVLRTDGTVEINGRLRTIAISHEIELKAT